MTQSARFLWATLVTFGCFASTFQNRAAAQSPPLIPFKSRELQEGKNYVKKLTATLAVGESAGELTTSYRIDIPTGRGVTPSVSLEYSSSAGPSEYGAGWDLTLPTIERSPERFTITDRSHEGFRHFRYRNGHQIADLEKTSEYTADGWTVYRERRERTFNRYLVRDNTWRILTPSGLLYELGLDSASRRGVSVTAFDGTYAWLVNRISDPFSNYAGYAYELDPAGQPRVTSIAYNGNATTGVPAGLQVTFNWRARATSPVGISYRSGYKRIFGQDYLHSIVVTAPQHATTGPAAVPAISPTSRTYYFTYSQATALDPTFMLISARVTGFPVTSYDYTSSPSNEPYASQVAMGAIGGSPGFPDSLGYSDTILNSSGGTDTLTKRVLVDVNSDARVDLIDSSNCGSYTVWLNTGSGFQKQIWPALQLSDIELQLSPPDACSLRTVTVSGSDSNTHQDFFDLDGDGYPDIVWVFNASGGGPAGIAYCPGNGSAFEACRLYTRSAFGGNEAAYLRHEESTFTNLTRARTDFIDINGDGLVDHVTVDDANLQLVARLNVGSGMSEAIVRMPIPACPTIAYATCLRLTEAVVSGAANRRIFAEIRDINGDGLPDFVRQPAAGGSISISYGNFSPLSCGGSPQLCQGFESTAQVAVGLGVIGQGTTANGDYLALIDLVDVNGDGLPDSVERLNTIPRSILVRFNEGGSVWDGAGTTYTLAADTFPSGFSYFAAELSSLREEMPPPGVQSRVTVRSSFVDLDGDGLPDFISAQIPPALGEFTLFARKAAYVAPRRLLAARSLGGNSAMIVSYAPENASSPYPMHVVRTLKRIRSAVYPGEPARYTSNLLTYSYGLMTFDRINRQFTSFGQVNVVGKSFATRSSTNYETDFWLAGLMSSKSVRNNSASGAAEFETNTYELRNLGPNRNFAQLTQRTATSETSAGGAKRTRMFQYTGHDSFGSPTTWYEFGDPADFTDDIVHNVSYVSSETTTRLFHLVSSEAASSSAGGRASTTRKFYDDRGLFGATPTRGALVRVQQEREQDVFVNVDYDYDTNGNVIRKTEPVNFISSFSYDSTYELCRVSTTSPLGQTQQSCHMLTGDIADSCGPQTSGSTARCTRTEIDVLGRITKTYVPTFASGIFSKSLFEEVAYDDVSYPLSTTVLRRGVAHTVEYRDGFGNPTELRVEETPNTYRVYETSFDAYDKAIVVQQTRREAGGAYAHGSIGEPWLYDHDYVHDTIERVTHPRESGDTSPAATASRVIQADRIVSTDEDGRITSYFLDHHKRVATIAQLTDAGMAVTAFQYATPGYITTVTAPDGLVTRYGRNLLGWLMSVTTPDGRVLQHTYNDASNLIATLDPRGVLVTHSYDAANRKIGVLSSAEPAGVRHVDATYVYYGTGDPSQFGYLQTESSDGITQTYTYTAEGALASHRSDFGAQTGTVSFQYDIGSRLGRVTYPDGYEVAYAYNLDDSVLRVSDGADRTLAGYLYEDDGSPSVVTNQFGLDESFTYDVRGRRTGVTSTNTSVTAGNLVDDRFGYTKGSLPIRIESNGLRVGVLPRPTPDVFDISLDLRGRLKQVTLNGSVSAAYSYDIAGKLLNFQERSAGRVTSQSSESTYGFDLLQRRRYLQGPSPEFLEERLHDFEYDASGNVVRDNLRTLSGSSSVVGVHNWDASNRYAGYQREGGTSSETTTYYYSPSGDLSRVINPGAAPATSDVLYVGSFARKDASSGTWTDVIQAHGTVIAESIGPRLSRGGLSDRIGGGQTDRGYPQVAIAAT